MIALFTLLLRAPYCGPLFLAIDALQTGSSLQLSTDVRRHEPMQAFGLSSTLTKAGAEEEAKEMRSERVKLQELLMRFVQVWNRVLHAQMALERFLCRFLSRYKAIAAGGRRSGPFPGRFRLEIIITGRHCGA